MKYRLEVVHFHNKAHTHNKSYTFQGFLNTMSDSHFENNMQCIPDRNHTEDNFYIRSTDLASMSVPKRA